MKKISLLTNEKGSVIVLALVMLVLLTLLGMAVTRTSSIEVQIASNDRRAADNLYTAESADRYALEDTNAWMTNAFLTNSETTTYYKDTTFDYDRDGTPDTLLEIRCIVSPAANNGNVSNEANDLPVMQHIAPPPPNSGYSLKYFEVRKYGITGTALNGGTAVQLGAYKVFNKN
ncbi:MAG: PilX N-terminal domain-containing pilus assembly protein [Desulfobacterales bacterium]